MCDMPRLACKVILCDVGRYLIIFETKMRVLFWHLSLEAIMNDHLLCLTFGLLLGERGYFFPLEVVVVERILSLFNDMRDDLINNC